MYLTIAVADHCARSYCRRSARVADERHSPSHPVARSASPHRRGRPRALAPAHRSTRCARAPRRSARSRRVAPRLAESSVTPAARKREPIADLTQLLARALVRRARTVTLIQTIERAREQHECASLASRASLARRSGRIGVRRGRDGVRSHARAHSARAARSPPPRSPSRARVDLAAGDRPRSSRPIRPRRVPRATPRPAFDAPDRAALARATASLATHVLRCERTLGRGERRVRRNRADVRLLVERDIAARVLRRTVSTGEPRSLGNQTDADATSKHSSPSERDVKKSVHGAHVELCTPHAREP